MAELWSEQRKHSTWRRLWVALAEAERELGIEISEAQISELRAATDDIDFALAAKYEKELRHDVMAHVHAYGDRCPSVRDHPFGGHKLLCHGQHRPDSDA